MAQPSTSGALEWLTEKDSIERESARTRLRDNASSLLEAYHELLATGLQGAAAPEVHQQVDEVRSAVLAAGMVQSADTLQQLESELRRSALLADHTKIAEEVASVTAAHADAAADGERRLSVVAAEMQAALRVLEANFYGCSVRGDDDIL